MFCLGKLCTHTTMLSTVGQNLTSKLVYKLWLKQTKTCKTWLWLVFCATLPGKQVNIGQFFKALAYVQFNFWNPIFFSICGCQLRSLGSLENIVVPPHCIKETVLLAFVHLYLIPKVSELNRRKWQPKQQNKIHAVMNWNCLLIVWATSKQGWRISG